MLIGLVGKPSCGKSTFFKASTLADVLIASYPFATIEPNRGIGYVRVKSLCSELGVKCDPRTGYCDGNVRFVPVNLMDVAGLVSGASEGKGLGNQFLDELRRADLFVHIVDCSGSTDPDGQEGAGDPVEDVLMLERELDNWYFGVLKRAWDKLVKTLQQTKEDSSRAIARQFSGLGVREEDVTYFMKNMGLDFENLSSWNDEEIHSFSRELRRRTKPMIIAANKVDKAGAKENLERLKSRFPDSLVVACSADSELSLRQAAAVGLIDYVPGGSDFVIFEEKVNDKQKEALIKIKENVLDVFGSTGVQTVLDSAVFDFLKYIAVFPAGSKLKDSQGRILADCFLLPPGSTALDFAYHLHTDIGKHFVKAIDVRTKMAVGKEHVLKNRDGIEILTD